MTVLLAIGVGIAIVVVGVAVTYGLVAPLKSHLARGARLHEAERTADEPIRPPTAVEFDGLSPEQADEFIDEFRKPRTIRECHIDDV